MNLISFQEPEDLRMALWDMYEEHALPEEHGADFIIPSRMGLVGIQRKAFPSDFLASRRPAQVGGSRLQREINQMQFFPIRILLLEGSPKWSKTGELVTTGHDKCTLRQLQGMEASLTWVHNFQVVWTPSKTATVDYLRWLPGWLDKREHGSLLRRPKCANPWQDSHSPERKIDMLSTLPNVSRKRAIAILRHTNGAMPVSANLDFSEVPGIGKKINSEIVRFLEEPCIITDEEE